MRIRPKRPKRPNTSRWRNRTIDWFVLSRQVGSAGPLRLPLLIRISFRRRTSRWRNRTIDWFVRWFPPTFSDDWIWWRFRRISYSGESNVIERRANKRTAIDWSYQRWFPTSTKISSSCPSKPLLLKQFRNHVSYNRREVDRVSWLWANALNCSIFATKFDLLGLEDVVFLFFKILFQ